MTTKPNLYLLGDDCAMYGIDKKGCTFCFDLQDFNVVWRYRWSVDFNGYVVGSGSGKQVKLHRLLLNPNKVNLLTTLMGTLRTTEDATCESVDIERTCQIRVCVQITQADIRA